MKTRIAVLLVAAFVMEGCVSYQVLRSDLRSREPARYEPAPDIVLTATGEVDSVFNKKSTPFLPASVMIEADNERIYIDPLEVDESRPADYILITHAHADHLSLPDIRRLWKPGTVVICPGTAMKSLAEFQARKVIPGERFQLGAIAIETVPAYNNRSLFLWLKAHPRKDDNVGYIVTVHGKRIYHAGDTDFVPELRALGPIDMVLLPLSGSGLTMSPEEAADAVNTIRPEAAVPLHYDPSSEAFERFRARVDPGITVVDLRSRSGL